MRTASSNRLTWRASCPFRPFGKACFRAFDINSLTRRAIEVAFAADTGTDWASSASATRPLPSDKVVGQVGDERADIEAAHVPDRIKQPVNGREGADPLGHVVE